MKVSKDQKAATIGAGIAGATCAHALTLAGHPVRVFGKYRGAVVAWLSVHSMSAVLLPRASDAADASTATATHQAAWRLVA